MNAEIITKRVEKLRALMADKKLDAFILIVDERANSESCHYISGFRGSSAGLIVSMNESTIITDGRSNHSVRTLNASIYCEINQRLRI